MSNSTLSENLEVFKLAVDSAFNHIIITDVDGKIVYANDAVTRITGYSSAEVIGKTPRLWGGQMPAEFYRTLWHHIKDLREPYEAEIDNKRKNGELYHALLIISPIIDKKGKLVGFIGTEEDITRIEKAQEDLEKEKVTLEKVNHYMVDRELKMMKLKQEIEALKAKISQHV